MQVILLEADKNLGSLGTIANVKAGYARNYLIPQGKAKFATKENLALFEKEKEDLVKKAAALLEKARQQAQEMENLVCTISANAGDEGKLFGSISTAQITVALEELGHKVEKRSINMPDGLIRYLGDYQIDIDLHAEVNVKISVEVVAG